MFIPATAHINRPLLLILDGHAAHVNINIIRLMQEHQIICLILPPHSTHALQPIDVVLFNTVKNDWSSIISNHLKAGHKSIKNAHIPRLMKRLFVDKQAFSTTRIVSSFSRAGKRSELVA
jgi:DDE superfamily endonuclease